MRLIDADKLKESLIDRTFQNGLKEFQWTKNVVDAQPTVQQWIPVSDRMPNCEEEVLIQTNKCVITMAMYEDGTISEDDSIWNWNEIEYDYDEETDIRYIPKGWWEYKHFAPDDICNYEVEHDVIAWMPLPNPYKEKSE